LPAILALAQGADVLATDHYEAALDFTAYNARANLDRVLEVSVLDWRQPDTTGMGTFGLVLAADVLYERKNAVALADLVPRLLAPGGEAIFADPRRDEAPVFFGTMKRRGFEDATEEITIEQPERGVKVLLHRLRR
jgi:predicted nicotinamide N-methyase